MPIRACLLCLLMLLALPVAADDRRTLGNGRLFSNDHNGDGHDRWRTGAYALSVLRGPTWDGRPPPDAGALLKYRLQAEIIAPGAVSRVDRPYAGTVTFGVASHQALGAADLALGVEIAVAGPQTRLHDFQTWIHDRTGLPAPRGLASQLPDAAHPGVFAELVRPWRITPALTLRPFAEARAGIEDLVRNGADAILGRIGHGDLWLRDVPTGQLYRGIAAPQPGLPWSRGSILRG